MDAADMRQADDEALAYLTEGADELPPSPKPNVVELGYEMRRLKAKIDELEDARKELQARYDAIRKRELLDAMAEAGLGSFKFDDGASIYIRREFRASVKEADRPKFFAWLRDHGHANLIVPQVNHQTLNAWTREQKEYDRELPSELTVFEEPLAVLKGAAGK